MIIVVRPSLRARVARARFRGEAVGREPSQGEVYARACWGRLLWLKAACRRKLPKAAP